jgi:hypothetical protein
VFGFISSKGAVLLTETMYRCDFTDDEVANANIQISNETRAERSGSADDLVSQSSAGGRANQLFMSVGYRRGAIYTVCQGGLVTVELPAKFGLLRTHRTPTRYFRLTRLN